MEKRDRMDAGISQFPRTRTSRVPAKIISTAIQIRVCLLTISNFIKAMFRIAMARKDDNFVTTILKSNGGINN